MLEAAYAQEERNSMRIIRTEFRNKFDPMRDLSENGFRDAYRLSKDAFLFVCSELREHSLLRSTKRITLETKVGTYMHH